MATRKKSFPHAPALARAATGLRRLELLEPHVAGTTAEQPLIAAKEYLVEALKPGTLPLDFRRLTRQAMRLLPSIMGLTTPR